MKKKFYWTVHLSVITMGIVLSACSSTNLMTLSVTEPAAVNVPSVIKKIGIIDRSMPSEKNATLDRIDKILSAEGKNLDKDGAQACVTGLFDELNKHNRFTGIQLIDNETIKSPGLGVFPSALPWKTIEQLCAENKVDAIIALSFYDTDARIDYKAVPVEIANPLGIKIPAIEHHASINTHIRAGWRFYDPINKNILDEFAMSENAVSTGRGINPAKAIEAVLGRKESVKQISNEMGYNYSFRLLPFNIRVSRDYFVRGTDNFKIAKRRAQTGNWDGAAELWSKEVLNPKGKVAGRACYNMAINHEINGNLDTAVEWASKSYSDYGNKLALRYLNILKNRIHKNAQLKQQLEQ